MRRIAPAILEEVTIGLTNDRISLTRRLVPGPVQFRELLQRLGPTFIKLGQFLALRPDIIPQEYCDELMELLDRVPPFSWSEAVRIFKEDFGREPTEVFDWINPRPLAAGSLAQVHSARTFSGREVAVKIQRPNIVARVSKDLRRARLIARVMELGHVTFISSPEELLDELRNWMLQEIDFEHELSNVTELYRLSADSPCERIPKPYPELSSSRVLTIELLKGIPVSEVLVALRSGRPEELNRIDDMGVDLTQFAMNLVRSTFTQVFRYHFFHADLHPGNLLILPDEVIGYVDFGLCDELDETVRKGQLHYLSAVYNRDVDQMFKALLDILTPEERSNVESFRMDFLSETRKWMAKAEHGRTYNTKDQALTDHFPNAQWLIGVLRIARKNGYRIPQRVLSMYRALVTSETVAASLAPDADLGGVGREFFSNLSLTETLRSLEPGKWQPVLLDLLSMTREVPGQLRQVMADLTEGRLTVKVEVADSPRNTRARNRRARLLVTSLLTVSVAFLMTRGQLPAWGGISLAWPLGIVLALLYLSVYLQWRRLR